ncbi:hypothetical protein [Rhodanobacter umsongensis]
MFQPIRDIPLNIGLLQHDPETLACAGKPCAPAKTVPACRPEPAVVALRRHGRWNLDLVDRHLDLLALDPRFE